MKLMNKILAITMVITLTLAMAGCGNKKESVDVNESTEKAQAAESATEDATLSTGQEEASTEDSKSSEDPTLEEFKEVLDEIYHAQSSPEKAQKAAQKLVDFIANHGEELTFDQAIALAKAAKAELDQYKDDEDFKENVKACFELVKEEVVKIDESVGNGSAIAFIEKAIDLYLKTMS